MDRIALAKRLESLSSVFASHTPYNRDLRAMSYVLNKMADDKFTGILAGDFAPDTLDACMCGGKGPGGPSLDLPGMGGSMPKIIPVGGPEVVELPEEGQGVVEIKLAQEEKPMSAEATEKTAGMFWCKEASKAVVDNLLRDVVGMNKSVCCDTGRKLEKEQIPDGTKAAERAPTLTEEQTPNIAESLDSGMVEKSHGKVEKEATSGSDIAEAAKKKKADQALALLNKKNKEEKKSAKKSEKSASEEGEEAEKKAEAKEEKAEELVEKATEQLEEAKENLEEAKKEEESAEKNEKDATSSIIDGIELMASMDEVELDAREAAQLSKLFE